MNVARITVVIISVISIILASNPDSSVFEIVSFAWADLELHLDLVVLCALFWKKLINMELLLNDIWWNYDIRMEIWNI